MLLSEALINHKCQKCRSVPVHFVDQGSNDPKPGILTYNYVVNAACTGECILVDHSTPPNPVEDTSSNYYHSPVDRKLLRRELDA